MTLRPAPQLSIVVPCFNEELVLPETAARLQSVVRGLVSAGEITATSSITFVDDGSTDDTWKLIEGLCSESGSVFRGLKLSRNHGHQNALLAGLLRADSDVVISIDADLQDDPEAIPQMIAAYRAGAEIVFGVRRGRSSDSWVKRTSAEAYYKLLSALGVEIHQNHADYRLMSRKAIQALSEFEERNLFLRGLIPRLGFSTAVVYYDRGARFAGESKYPMRKMVALAIDGITSLSTVPLRAITLTGIMFSLVSIGLAGWAFWVRISGRAVPGWASTVVPICLIGGIQLFCTGIIGQYVAKIYIETKRRPRFIIESQIGMELQSRSLHNTQETHPRATTRQTGSRD
jgi:polyisoprenyl-phosphate glycosyltransferase